jgi:hypothetical protein
MPGKNHKEIHVGRRDFIKTTALAGMAATLSETRLAGQDSEGPSERRRMGKKLLFMSDSPENYEQLIESIKSIPGANLLVSPIKVNFQKPQEIIPVIRSRNADILLMCISRFTFSFGKLGDAMSDLNIPIIIFSANKNVLLIDANLAASLRANGANVKLALSQKRALELVKIAAFPRILENRRALLYGRPFDSTSVPAYHLSEELVYKRTGVMIRYRPLEELAAQLENVDEASAGSEMARWKNEAMEIVRVSDKTILDSCRLYVLLRSIIEKEELSAISIDCLGFTLSPKPVLPYPCLAFSRLRDEGIAAACEADVYGMLSLMFLQEICRKPAFMCNVNSVNVQHSTILLSHCTAPLKLHGSNNEPARYRLHDYHGFGRGVVPEVEFPSGMEVTAGAFTKDLKSFVSWPGRILAQVKDTERSSSKNSITLDVCANTMDVKIKDADRFLQNIPGAHMIMIAGNHTNVIEDALFGMNAGIVGPSDFAPPDV